MRHVLSAVLVAFLALPAFAEDRIFSNSYLGKRPPELIAEKGHWINAPEALVAGGLKALEGRVVYLQFGSLKDEGGGKSRARLVDWDLQYADKGLVVLEVGHGDKDSLADLKAGMAAAHVSYPVLHDAKAQSSKAYGVRGLPSAFLIDASGKVVWEGFPGLALDRIETLILKCLKDAKPPAPAKEKPETAKEDPPMAKDAKKEVVLPSGLKITDLAEGDGATPKDGDTLEMHYTGWLDDGTKFDSSLDRGEPLPFTLGKRQVIPGWEQGVVGMKVGGRRRLVIPPDMAYGPRGSPPVIPANATLTFEIQLVRIR